MNFKVVLKLLGNVIKYELILMFIPLIISFIYRDGDTMSFALTMIMVAPITYLLCRIEPGKPDFYAKEGFLTVGLSWIFISIVGAIPFVLSGVIPDFIDAFFETVSGFTTTGATIMTFVEGLPRGIMFWRSFTHWIGGMGVLIFVLSLIPNLGSNNTIHLLRAESPGPSPGKIVPKIKDTAKILYLIYLALTIIEAIILMFLGMSPYDAFLHALGTAGTGGFSNMNNSIAGFNNPAIEWVIAIFMIVFGVNFTLYFQLIKGNLKSVLKSDELKAYLLIIFASVIFISINILNLNHGDISKSVRDATFQVSSIISTTGYATVDYNMWPTFSKMIIFLIMIAGGMAGSTAGGIKTIRIVIVLKAIKREIDKILHPRRVKSVKIEGKVAEEDTISGVFLFLGAYAVIALIGMFIVALDGFDFTTTLSSVVTAISNVGPGFEMVGPAGNFSEFSHLSKCVLSFCMLAGRLEIYPMLILCSPSLWRKKY